MRGVLSFSAAHRLALRVGILGGTLALLGGLAWAGLWGASTGDLVAAFRVVIACSVLPLSILGPSLPRGEGVPVVPFPLHIQALIGTLPVLWLFRVVGLVWLVMGLQHLGGRVLGGVP
jgi:hypothetical protein